MINTKYKSVNISTINHESFYLNDIYKSPNHLPLIPKTKGLYIVSISRPSKISNINKINQEVIFTIKYEREPLLTLLYGCFHRIRKFRPAKSLTLSLPYDYFLNQFNLKGSNIKFNTNNNEYINIITDGSSVKKGAQDIARIYIKYINEYYIDKGKNFNKRTYNETIKALLAYKIMYIGISNDILNRIRSHEKIQKILVEMQAEYLDAQISIMTIQPSARGMSHSFSLQAEQEVVNPKNPQDSEHEQRNPVKKPFDIPILTQDELINTAEGVLINYFKPQENILKKKFPLLKRNGKSKYITKLIDNGYTHIDFILNVGDSHSVVYDPHRKRYLHVIKAMINISNGHINDTEPEMLDNPYNLWVFHKQFPDKVPYKLVYSFDPDF